MKQLLLTPIKLKKLQLVLPEMIEGAVRRVGQGHGRETVCESLFPFDNICDAFGLRPYSLFWANHPATSVEAARNH
ncbi:hypothetical protein [Pseudoduganella namucuonensis]|uniref:hypothetical protein n=1 Tax=Pseudoduganella namucuonensis TaxID=1035707 RepID=UPI0011604DF4|nr:hypothetical protein [Pseudoduganella namucuonensis]